MGFLPRAIKRPACQNVPLLVTLRSLQGRRRVFLTLLSPVLSCPPLMPSARSLISLGLQKGGFPVLLSLLHPFAVVLL